MCEKSHGFSRSSKTEAGNGRAVGVENVRLAPMAVDTFDVWETKREGEGRERERARGERRGGGEGESKKENQSVKHYHHRANSITALKKRIIISKCYVNQPTVVGQQTFSHKVEYHSVALHV